MFFWCSVFVLKYKFYHILLQYGVDGAKTNIPSKTYTLKPCKIIRFWFWECPVTLIPSLHVNFRSSTNQPLSTYNFCIQYSSKTYFRVLESHVHYSKESYELLLCWALGKMMVLVPPWQWPHWEAHKLRHTTLIWLFFLLGHLYESGWYVVCVTPRMNTKKACRWKRLECVLKPWHIF